MAKKQKTFVYLQARSQTYKPIWNCARKIVNTHRASRLADPELAEKT